MNIELIVCIVVTLLILILFILNKIKYNKLTRKYIDKCKDCTRIKNKISMIEYFHRDFKEGKNPYTVLRDIKSILDSEDIDE